MTMAMTLPTQYGSSRQVPGVGGVVGGGGRRVIVAEAVRLGVGVLVRVIVLLGVGVLVRVCVAEGGRVVVTGGGLVVGVR